MAGNKNPSFSGWSKQDIDDFLTGRKRERDLVEEINGLLLERTILTKDLKDIEVERQSLGQILVGTSQDQLTYELERIAVATDHALNEKRLAETRIEQHKQELEDVEELLAHHAVLTAEQSTHLDLHRQGIKTQEDIIENQKKILALNKEDTDQYGKKLKLAHGLQGAMGSIAVKMGLSAKTSDSLLGKLIHSAQNMRNMVKHAGGWKNGIKEVAKQFANVFSITNILSAVITALFKASLEFILAFSKAVSEFNAATGTAGRMAGVVSGSMDLSAGVDIEEAAAATTGLAQSYTEFADRTDGAAKSLGKTTAQLTRLNISATTTGKNITYATKAMGMTEKAAEHLVKGLAAAASALGKVPAQLAEEFASAQSSLSSHGPQMIDVFYKLQGQAKKTGIAFSELQKMADKFDTFESAAASVGNLNALLGGDYMNSIEMMNMTENERIETVKRAIQAQGLQFNQMERFQRKAIAKQLGFDTAQLAKLLESQTEEEKKAAEEAARRAATEAKYQKMLSSTVNILRRFQLMLASIFREKSVMEGMWEAMDVFFITIKENMPAILALMGDLGKVMKMVISLMVYVVVPIMSMIGAFLALNEMLGGMLIPTIIGLSIALKAYAFVTGLVAIAQGLAWWKWAAMGAIVIGTLIALKSAIVDPGSPSLLQALGMLAVAILLSGLMGGSAAWGMLAFGAAVLMVGGGVWLAAQGVEQLGNAISLVLAAVGSVIEVIVSSVKELFLSILALGDTKSLMAMAALPAFFLSLSISATALAAATPALLLVGVAMGALIALIANFPEDKMTNITTLMKELSLMAAGIIKTMGDTMTVIFLSIGTAMSTVVSAVSELVKSLSQLGTGKVLAAMAALPIFLAALGASSMSLRLFGTSVFSELAVDMKKLIDEMVRLPAEKVVTLTIRTNREDAANKDITSGTKGPVAYSLSLFDPKELWESILKSWDAFWEIPAPGDGSQKAKRRMGESLSSGIMAAMADLPAKMSEVYESFGNTWDIHVTPIFDSFLAVLDRIILGVEALGSIMTQMTDVAIAFAQVPRSGTLYLTRGVEGILHAASTVKNPSAPLEVIRAAVVYQKEKQKADVKNAAIPDELMTLLKANQGAGGGNGGPVEVVLRWKDGLDHYVERVTNESLNSYG